MMEWFLAIAALIWFFIAALYAMGFGALCEEGKEGDSKRGALAAVICYIMGALLMLAAVAA